MRAGSRSAPAGDEDGRAAVVDGDSLEEPVGHERVDDRADPRDAASESPVLDDPGFRQRAACGDGAQRQRAQTLGSRRERGVEAALRDHALGQVVEPLEPLAAGDHEVAVVPEPIEHRLGGLPVPHPALARSLEVA